MVQAADSAEADCAVAARCKDMADGKKALSGLDCRTAADGTDLAVTKMSVHSVYAAACGFASKVDWWGEIDNEAVNGVLISHGYVQDAAPQTPPIFRCERLQKDWAAGDLDAYAEFHGLGQLRADYSQAADFWRDHMASLLACRRGLGQLHAEYSQAANLLALQQAQGSKQICYLSAYSLGRACVCHGLEVLKSKGWFHRQILRHHLTHCPYHTSKIPDSEQDPQCKLHKQM